MTPGERNLSVYGLESTVERDPRLLGLEVHHGSRRRLPGRFQGALREVAGWIESVLVPRRRQHANDIAILRRVDQLIRAETSRVPVEDREWLYTLRARVDGFLAETGEPDTARPNP